MVPAWRGNGEREGERGAHAERDSRSLTYSIATYGDRSDVNLMIGVDGERQIKAEETDGRKEMQRFTVLVNQIDIQYIVV